MHPITRSLATRSLAVLTVTALGGAALAQNYSPANSILSGVQSNGSASSTQTSYAFNFDRAAGDPITYINSVQIIPGASFDTDISLDTGAGFNLGQSDQYLFGTPLTGDLSRTFRDLAFKRDGFGTNVEVGFYDFQIRLGGGDSATADDSLALLDFQMEIVETFAFTVGGSTSTGTIAPGGSVDTFLNVTNANGRDAIINSIYYFNPQLTGGGDELPGTFFDGPNVFFTPLGSTLTPGASASGMHSRFTARADQTPGVYPLRYGIIGGLYSGDEYSFDAPLSSVTVAPVPEPASLAALAVGGLALLRRRRK